MGHEFIKSLIEYGYGIKTKPSTSENTTYNVILEWIHQALGNLGDTYNLKETHIDEDDLWSAILVAAVFEIRFTVNRLKSYSMGQLIFGNDIILPIKHIVNWELMRQQNQT